MRLTCPRPRLMILLTAALLIVLLGGSLRIEAISASRSSSPSGTQSAHLLAWYCPASDLLARASRGDQTSPVSGEAGNQGSNVEPPRAPLGKSRQVYQAAARMASPVYPIFITIPITQATANVSV
jgi:hypothetical protein